MKTFLTIICGLICLLFVRTIRKRYFSICGIFIMMWTICLGLATCGLWGLDIPSWTVVFLSCSSMLIFAFFGVTNFPLIGTKKTLRKSYINGGTAVSAHPALCFLHILAYLFSLPFLRFSLLTLFTEGIYFVRENAFTSSAFASTAELIIFQTFIQPLFQVMIILTLLDIRNRKKCKLSIIFTVLNVILYTVLFAGRYIIFQLLVYVVFIMYDSPQIRNLSVFLKRHKKVCCVAIGVVIALFAMSEVRSQDSIFKSAYVYFCGSFSYLSKLIEQGVGTKLFLGGRTQWGFIYNFVFYALTFAFNIPYAGSNHLITQLTQYMIPIGDNIKYNSLGTMLHDFIADYGVYGSLFGVIIFATMCNYVERLKKVKQDYFSAGLYYYTLFAVVNSVLGYSLREPAALTVIILLYFFGNKQKMEG